MASAAPAVMLTAAISARVSPVFDIDVDLRAPAGITILFGPSGSGKTTVLRAIAGLVPACAGRVRVGDALLFDSSAGIDVPVRKRRLGYVGQHPAIFPHMTVEANVEYGVAAVESASRRERVDEMLRRFRVDQLKHRSAAHISGGERQRVALARSLATEPRALLLDEPLSALDHAAQTRVMADLRQWNETRGIPIVYVTHSHREAFELGERIVVLGGGRVQATGTPHEVLDAPGRHAVANVAGFENVFDAEVRAVHTRDGVMTCALGHADVEVPLSHADEGDRVRIAVRAGDILLAVPRPHGLSARNVLEGRVLSLDRRGATAVARVDAGATFEVHLTPGGASSLALTAGARVWVVIKTYSWRVLVDDLERTRDGTSIGA